MEKAKRGRRSWGSALLAVVALIVGSAPVFGLASPAAAADPEHVAFTLEGCRNPSVDLEASAFVCADGDYTSGNLGKTWNELDLVPHRLTIAVGAQSDATTEFDLAVAVDRFDDVDFASPPVYPGNGMPGYDLIGLFTKRSGDCAFTVAGGATSPTQFDTYSDGLGTQTDGIGGTDVTAYVKLHVSQPRNTTCVLDWVERLALGSHLYPGSSLHSNVALLTATGITTSGIGARDVSIPVKEIAPQELDKDMSATQGAEHLWSITKETSDASLAFDETCSAPGPTSDTVRVTVRWAKLGLAPSGDITVLTHIYATNPAHRALDVSMVDVIYSGTTVLHTFPAVNDTVAANSTELVATHQVNVPSGSTNLNDVATATYTDTVTGIAVPGTVTATASTSVSQGGALLNDTAVITDVEHVTGGHFSYSVDGVDAGSATGAFTAPGGGAYLLGTDTTQDVTWTSTTQADSGHVTFNKTVTVDEPSISSGTLADTATLTGDDGFVASANASIALSSDATVSLTINKTLPTTLAAGQSASFDFEVRDSGGLVVATPNVTIGAGQNDASVTVTGLDPGSYTVHELDDPYWDEPADANIAITLPSCTGSVTMANALQDLAIDIDKSVNGGNSATTHAGDTVTYTLVITNTGDVALELTSLVDAVNSGTAAPPGGTCATLIGTILDPDESVTCTYTAAPTIDTTNIATVVGTDTLDRTTTDNDSATVDVINPGITITKTASPDTFTGTTGTTTFTFVVTNTGDTTLFDVAVTDDVLGAIGTARQLEPGQSVTFTRPATVTDARPRNIATTTGTDALNKTVTDNDDAVVAFTPAQVLGVVIELPKTGLAVTPMIATGLLLVLAGLAALQPQRRRRHQTR